MYSIESTSSSPEPQSIIVPTVYCAGETVMRANRGDITSLDAIKQSLHIGIGTTLLIRCGLCVNDVPVEPLAGKIALQYPEQSLAPCHNLYPSDFQQPMIELPMISEK